VFYSNLQFHEGTPNRQQSGKSEGFYLLPIYLPQYIMRAIMSKQVR
ncbi:uncharacterized protein METZ01_LOCUS333006, partial [marine metagenome]